jgi:hypothetical protein
MAREARVDDELVLIDQAQLGQCQGKLKAAAEQAFARLLLELPHSRCQIAAEELSVPIDLVQGARNNVFLGSVDGLGEGFHPSGSGAWRGWGAKGSFHHLVDDPSKQQGIGPVEILDRVTMEVLVDKTSAMIAAAVESDVDGVAQGSHGLEYRFLYGGVNGQYKGGGRLCASKKSTHCPALK